MNLRYTPKYLFGATTLLVLGASLALAQDTSKARPRSQQRIPISKDNPTTTSRTGRGAPKVDTVTVTKYVTDTLRVTTQLPPRVDTVRTPPTTVTVHDTVQLAPPPRVMTYPSGIYFGLGGGVSAPNGALFNPNSSGPTAQVNLGWQSLSSPIGIRFDANWAKPGEDAAYAGYQADPDIINVSGDLKLTLPWFHHMFGMTPMFNLYGIGGGTYVTYKNLPYRMNPGVACPTGSTCVPPINVRIGEPDWNSKFGWNAGGGASIGWHRTEIFFETRVIGFTPDNSPMARQMPFVLGANWFTHAR
jgi:hypothetical protein